MEKYIYKKKFHRKAKCLSKCIKKIPRKPGKKNLGRVVTLNTGIFSYLTFWENIFVDLATL